MLAKETVSADDTQDDFMTQQEFVEFFQMEGGHEVAQFAGQLWEAGHQSCMSVAGVKLAKLAATYGPEIGPCHSFCRAHAGQHIKH